MLSWFRRIVEFFQQPFRSKRPPSIASVLLVTGIVVSVSNYYLLVGESSGVEHQDDAAAAAAAAAPASSLLPNIMNAPIIARGSSLGTPTTYGTSRYNATTSTNKSVLDPSSSATTTTTTTTPRFILHIGPHKTATTSIQCALYHYREELKHGDSCLFLGKVDERFCSFPAKQKEPFQQDERIRKIQVCIGDTECWTKLTSEWDENRKQGFDMVLSKEGISDLASQNHSESSERERFWTAMEDALVGWNVTVVLTYRRFFEWLPSALNQHAFHMRLQARKEPWPVSPETPRTLEQMVAGVLRGTNDPPYPFVDTILQKKLPSNWNFYVMNMHRTPDVVQAFLCEEVLNAARQTCANYQSLSQSRQSPSYDLVYDYLNVQALHWGWMGHQGRRGQRARSTRNFVENVLKSSPRDFPQDCPSRSLLESFLAYSIAMEEKVLGSVDVWYHTDRFWKFSKNLCTVNATKVLLANGTIWKTFYESL